MYITRILPLLLAVLSVASASTCDGLGGGEGLPNVTVGATDFVAVPLPLLWTDVFAFQYSDGNYTNETCAAEPLISITDNASWLSPALNQTCSAVAAPIEMTLHLPEPLASHGPRPLFEGTTSAAAVASVAAEACAAIGLVLATIVTEDEWLAVADLVAAPPRGSISAAARANVMWNTSSVSNVTVDWTHYPEAEYQAAGNLTGGGAWFIGASAANNTALWSAGRSAGRRFQGPGGCEGAFGCHWSPAADLGHAGPVAVYPGPPSSLVVAHDLRALPWASWRLGATAVVRDRASGEAIGCAAFATARFQLVAGAVCMRQRCSSAADCGGRSTGHRRTTLPNGTVVTEPLPPQPFNASVPCDCGLCEHPYSGPFCDRTPTATASPSSSPALTDTSTDSGTVATTPSRSPSSTVAPTPSRSPKRTASATPSFSAASTASSNTTTSRTPVQSDTPSRSTSPTATRTVVATATFTRRPPPSTTESQTRPLTATRTRPATPTNTPTRSPVLTPTRTPKATRTALPTQTPTLTRTLVRTPTATPAASVSSTFTRSMMTNRTFTAAGSRSTTASVSPSASASRSPRPTRSATAPVCSKQDLTALFRGRRWFPLQHPFGGYYPRRWHTTERDVREGTALRPFTANYLRADLSAAWTAEDPRHASLRPLHGFWEEPGFTKAPLAPRRRAFAAQGNDTVTVVGDVANDTDTDTDAEAAVVQRLNFSSVWILAPMPVNIAVATVGDEFPLTAEFIETALTDSAQENPMGFRRLVRERSVPLVGVAINWTHMAVWLKAIDNYEIALTESFNIYVDCVWLGYCASANVSRRFHIAHVIVDPSPDLIELLSSAVVLAGSMLSAIGAPDLQAIAIIGLMRCSNPQQRSLGNFRVVSPAAITNDALGALYGCLAILGGAATLNVAAVLVMRAFMFCVPLTKEQRRALHNAGKSVPEAVVPTEVKATPAEGADAASPVRRCHVRVRPRSTLARLVGLEQPHTDDDDPDVVDAAERQALAEPLLAPPMLLVDSCMQTDDLDSFEPPQWAPPPDAECHGADKPNRPAAPVARRRPSEYDIDFSEQPFSLYRHSMLKTHFYNTWTGAMARAFCPTLTIVVATAMFQGIAFCSVQLLVGPPSRWVTDTDRRFREQMIGLGGILFAAVIMIAFTVTPAIFVSRSFLSMRYDGMPDSDADDEPSDGDDDATIVVKKSAGAVSAAPTLVQRLPLWLKRFFLPSGIIMGVESMRMFSPLVGFTSWHPVWPTLPLWSPLILAIGGGIPLSSVESCGALFWVLAMLHVGIAAAVLGKGPFRIPSVNAITAMSSVCIALLLIFSATSASNNTNIVYTIVIVVIGFCQSLLVLLRATSIFFPTTLFTRLTVGATVRVRWVYEAPVPDPQASVRSVAVSARARCVGALQHARSRLAHLWAVLRGRAAASQSQRRASKMQRRGTLPCPREMGGEEMAGELAVEAMLRARVMSAFNEDDMLVDAFELEEVAEEAPTSPRPASCDALEPAATPHSPPFAEPPESFTLEAIEDAAAIHVVMPCPFGEALDHEPRMDC